METLVAFNGFPKGRLRLTFAPTAWCADAEQITTNDFFATSWASLLGQWAEFKHREQDGLKTKKGKMRA
jgi:hypothetical protein